MTLRAGTKLGSYEIVAPLGAGGMGEVYRARDPRLQRDVAIKVLPARLSEDADALARFEREARAVAALSHPNILAIYEFGRHDATAYAVTELLEGETLRSRLEGGPLPPRKVAEVGAQIARGLAAAHDRGVVHRDLKPDNVFITREGQVKILDFGLARSPVAREAESGMESPTLTRHTDPGTVMGTAAYMSPEQVKGQPVDHRSDIFAFGAVLYEMATGHRAFQSASAAETMAAILRAEAPEPPQSLPVGIVRIVRRCLEKDREGRFQAARDIAFDLEDTSSASALPAMAPPPALGARRRWLLLAGAVVAVACAAFVAGRRSASAPASHAPLRFRQVTDLPGAETSPRLSPDGRTLVFVSRASGNADIYVQRVGGHNPINITKDCELDDSSPSFSPDGERIAFRSQCDGGGIFLVGATGESRKRVTDFGHDPAWSPDGKKLAVAAEQTLNPMNRYVVPSTVSIVDVDTGARQPLASTDAMQPAWAPSGRRIAYWGLRGSGGRGSGGQRDLWTIAVEPGASPVAVTSDGAVDWNPAWSPDGRWLYFASSRGGAMNLWRVSIDETTGRVLSPPEPMTVPALWSGGLGVSRDGRNLVYATAEPRSSIERVAFDPVQGVLAGAPETVLKGSRTINSHSPSPDGQWIAFSSGGLRENLFVVRMDGTGYRQLTDDEFRNRGPDWSPDGQRIAFYTDRSGRYEAWAIRADGSGLEQLTDLGPDVGLTVPRWTPDGLGLVTNGPPVRLFDLRRPLKERETRSLGPIAPGVEFFGGVWSPDGLRLVGWSLRADGSPTDTVVYDVPTNAYRRVPEAGSGAVWLNDGHRLLYLTADGALRLLDLRSVRSRQLLPAGTAATAFPWSCRLTRDNRFITFLHDTAEGDVWLADLD
ncbi:MAG TPA: protein kinase [Vicinamibacteria bacterium]|nr:protein kinase [Vicinamibacteria bacterium]